ncbi:MAG: hypothetical protein CMH11_11270 [Maritimibacter sp.]|nr:hypothetical protein [Maritimibacter sp.]|tara:strand:+ start:8188 stop:8838 length:651 start_codon:yes stop_codon:yes gene_type:complete
MIRIGIAVTLATTLSGCFLTGGGTGISGTKAEFDAAFLDAAGLGPTTTPLSGTATYNGEMQIITVDNAGQSGSIRGAVEMNANFASATPFSAEATNFSGEVRGTEVSYSGTLSSGQATDSSPINLLTTTALPAIAGGGEASAMTLSIGGTLTNEDTGVKNTLNPGSTMNGNFFGNDGKAVGGAVGWSVAVDGGTSAITGTGTGTNGAVGGQWYGEK